MHGFMFATGIENSYPTIANGVRIDQMEKCGHYTQWEEDLHLTREMGLRYLRWGPPLHRVFLGPGRYDWEWTDEVMDTMRGMDIYPILDLCHFGVPDWLENFQNPDFSSHFAEYAEACAARYSYVKYWTPVNEILITTLFSAKYGWWNEMLTTDGAFVRALLNVCRANLLAMKAILKHVPDAVFIQSESTEYTHPSRPELIPTAKFYNERRFLPLDLTYGHQVSASMYRYLMTNGMSEADYDFFMNQTYRYRCIMGTDYYVTNEHMLLPDGRTIASGEFFGYYVIARQYYDRYGLPLMHTETNIREEEGAVQWLWKEWNTLLRLRQDGVPIVGFTWYSLTDQIDWDIALREERNKVHTVGLYDLERKPRKVGHEYRRLVDEWRGFLPTGTSALMLV
jgi:beta-glucosidase